MKTHSTTDEKIHAPGIYASAVRLNATTRGDGPQIALLHGLGLHSSVWNDTAAALAQHRRVTCIDLPGHGQSSDVPPLSDLNGVADALAETVPGPATWIGWSLGGLYAITLALRHPDKCERLVLVASTPRFAISQDWPLGLSDEIFSGFHIDYDDGFSDMIRRFLTFQVRGSAAATKALRGLLATAAECPTQASSFRDGVDLLHDVDLRHHLQKVSCPVRFIMGEKDSFVQSQLAVISSKQVRDGHCTIIAGAGHAPFLSHPDLFMTELMHVLSE